MYTGVAAARSALAGGANLTDAMSMVKEFDFEDFQPEKIQTWEVGYKSLINDRLFIDAYYYFSNYTDFIAEVRFTQGVPGGLRVMPDGSVYTNETAVGTEAWKQSVITQTDPNNPNQSFATQSYGFDINADGNVRSHGWAEPADYSLNGGFVLGGNISTINY